MHWFSPFAHRTVDARAVHRHPAPGKAPIGNEPYPAAGSTAGSSALAEAAGRSGETSWADSKFVLNFLNIREMDAGISRRRMIYRSILPWRKMRLFLYTL